MKPILNIENLTKIYGNVPSQTKALNGITFQVMPGEFLGIMGDTIKTNWFANEAIRYILSLSPDALKKYMLVPLEPPLIS